jgi:hypothetical protein
VKRRYLAAVALAASLVVVLGTGTASANGPTSFNLYAGQNTLVGNGTVSNDATNLNVDFDLNDGWCMTESHVDAASTAAGIPNKNGNPIPGKFRFNATYNPCADGLVSPIVIPLAGLDSDPVIAVHLKVWDESSATAVTAVSDTTTTKVTSFNGTAQAPAAAVAAYEPVGYPTCGSYQLSPATGSVWDTQTGGSASNDVGGPFAGATWIWRTANPAFPDAGEYATFAKALTLPGPPAGPGSILITADNGYQVSLNGGFLGSAQILGAFPGSLKEDGVNTTNWQSPETWALPLQMGANTLSVVAANEFAWLGDTPDQQTTGVGGTEGGVCPNPGGLIFKAEYSYFTDGESAWGGESPGTEDFPGANWATYVDYELQDVLLQTLTVSSLDPDGETSAALPAGNYDFKASGSWTNRGGSDQVDTECTSESGGPWAANAAGYPDGLLELQVNNSDVDWTPVGSADGAGCAIGHEYTKAFPGAGAAVNFRIYDGQPDEPTWLGDNAGSLTVEIWKVFP